MGEAIPLATVVSTKPDGSVAAEPETDKAYNKNTIAMSDGALCIPESRKKQAGTVRLCFRRGQGITPEKSESAPALLPDEANTEWTDLKCIARVPLPNWAKPTLGNITQAIAAVRVTIQRSILGNAPQYLTASLPH